MAVMKTRNMTNGVLQEEPAAKQAVVTQGKVEAPVTTQPAATAQPTATTQPATEEPPPGDVYLDRGGQWRDRTTGVLVTDMPAKEASPETPATGAEASPEHPSDMPKAVTSEEGISYRWSGDPNTAADYLGVIETNIDDSKSIAQVEQWLKELDKLDLVWMSNKDETRLYNLRHKLKSKAAEYKQYAPWLDKELTFDWNSLTADQAQSAYSVAAQFVHDIGLNHPEAMTDPTHPLYRKYIEAQAAMASSEGRVNVAKAQGQLGEFNAMAAGENLDDTAAQQQLATTSDQAQAQARGMTAGPMGRTSARGQQIAAQRTAAMEQEERQASTLLKTQEQQWATEMAASLGADLEKELAEMDFNDANQLARAAEISQGYADAMANYKSDLLVAERIAEARKAAEDEESKNAWIRTIVGGAFTVGGAAIGTALAPGAGTVVGGAGGAAVGGAASSWLTRS